MLAKYITQEPDKQLNLVSAEHHPDLLTDLGRRITATKFSCLVASSVLSPRYRLRITVFWTIEEGTGRTKEKL